MKRLYPYAIAALVLLTLACSASTPTPAAPIPTPAAVNTAPARRLEAKPQPGGMFVTTLDNLQIRAEPSTAADVIGSLPYHARIEVEVAVVTVDDPICTRWRKLTARAGWVCAEWTDGSWE